MSRVNVLFMYDNDNHSHTEVAVPHPHPPVLSCFSFAGQILIWAGRQWIRASEDWDRVVREFTGALGHDRGKALIAGLDDLFSLMNVAARRPVVFGRCECHRVWPDEILVISAVQAEQRGHTRLALDALASVLPPASVRQALPMVSSIAQLFMKAGYRIESCRDLQPAAGLAFETLMTDRESATIH